MKRLFGGMIGMGMALVAAALLAAAVVVPSFTGCTTVSSTGTNGAPVFSTVLDTNTVVAAINLVVPMGVRLATEKDTNAGPYFAQASIVLRALSASGTVDPRLVETSLKAISIRELRSPMAIQAENAALALYQTFAAQAVSAQVDRVAWLRPVLAALGNAMQAGLPPP